MARRRMLLLPVTLVVLAGAVKPAALLGKEVAPPGAGPAGPAFAS